VFGTGNDPHAGLQGIETGSLLEAVTTVLHVARLAGTFDSAPG
jgi:hypothetical protein